MAKPLSAEVKAVNEATRKVEASNAKIVKIKEQLAAEQATLKTAKEALVAAKLAAKAAK